MILRCRQLVIGMVTADMAFCECDHHSVDSS